jgi:hypothetical protein
MCVRYLPDDVQLMESPFSGYRKQYPHKQIETDYVVRYQGRTHRVYCYQISNAGSLYIKSKGKRIFIR